MPNEIHSLPNPQPHPDTEHPFPGTQPPGTEQTDHEAVSHSQEAVRITRPFHNEQQQPKKRGRKPKSPPAPIALSKETQSENTVSGLPMATTHEQDSESNAVNPKRTRKPRVTKGAKNDEQFVPHTIKCAPQGPEALHLLNEIGMFIGLAHQNKENKQVIFQLFEVIQEKIEAYKHLLVRAYTEHNVDGPSYLSGDDNAYD